MLSWQALFVYILIFVALQGGLSLVARYRPGVLGVESSITKEELINLTNKERTKKGLPILRQNLQLSLAAAAKASNMFEENYWSHYSPSGKDPWGFITASGYKFSYAGENLARNFYASSDVVEAWMASPTHRENILNPKYQEVGIAAVYGVLKGQQTVLVVQEFGTPVEAIAILPGEEGARTSGVSEFAGNVNVLPQTLIAGSKTGSKPLLDPYKVTQFAGFTIIAVVALLVAIDFFVLRRRAALKLTPSKHLAHLALLSVAFSALLGMRPGSIL